MKKLFYNQILDKKGTKKILSWFLENYGPTRTSQFIEELKSVGFHFATEAGLSLGFDDLKIPKKKGILLNSAEDDVAECEKKFFQGKITAVERYQKLIDIWTTTSENLKDEVIDNFQKTDLFNPLYMMAFSGARGNISQVRQLVGMRGLMSDSAGGIIDFPIRSNFREGLTVTEYAISCYGARKGLIDTALRTADSGYLTRRLVDVAHGIMIGRLECSTKEGFDVSPLKSSGKSGSEGTQLISLEKRIIGRVLAEDIGSIIAFRNQEITPFLAQKIIQVKKEKVRVRSPLTCLHFQNFREDICQLCYGWSLAHGRLVSIGEAVGILAAQSIGEPGTQLTMRTFHTGGIFSTDIDAKIFAPHDGFISYSKKVKGKKIRTFHGQTAFFTFEPVQVKVSKIRNASNSSLFNELPNLQKNRDTNQVSIFQFPSQSLIFVYPGQFVSKNVLCAEVSQLMSAKVSTAQVAISSNSSNRAMKEQENFENTLPQTSENRLGEGLTLQRKSLSSSDVSEKGLTSLSSRSSAVPLSGMGVDLIQNGTQVLDENSQELNKPMSKKVLSEIEGQIYFHRLAERRQTNEFEKGSFVKGVGSLWVLAGKGIYTSGPLQSGDYISKKRHQVRQHLHVSGSDVLGTETGPFSLLFDENLCSPHKINYLKINNNKIQLSTFVQDQSELGLSSSSSSVNWFKKQKSAVFPKQTIFCYKKGSAKNRIRFSKKYSILSENGLKSQVQATNPIRSRSDVLSSLGAFHDLRYHELGYTSKNTSKDTFSLKIYSFSENQVLKKWKSGSLQFSHYKYFISNISQTALEKVNSLPKQNKDSTNHYEAFSNLDFLRIGGNGQKKNTKRPSHSAFDHGEVRIFGTSKSSIPVGQCFFSKPTKNLNLPTADLRIFSPDDHNSDIKQTSSPNGSKLNSEKVMPALDGQFNPTNSQILPAHQGLVRSNKKRELSVFSTKLKLGNLVRVGDCLTFSDAQDASTPRGLANSDSLEVSLGGWISEGLALEKTVQILQRTSSLKRNQVKKSLILKTKLSEIDFNETNNISKFSVDYTLRKVHPYLISHNSPLSVRHGDIVEARQFLFELFYQQSKTGDIVQGLPKIEQLFEARRTSLHVIETVHMRLKEKFDELCKKYPFYEAARLSIRFIQRILIDEIQSVYQSQGVDIADKHIEIIIRQMTSKVIVHEKGKSPFFPDDIVDFHQIQQFEVDFINWKHASNSIVGHEIERSSQERALGEISTEYLPVTKSFFDTNKVGIDALRGSESGIIFEPIVLGLTKVAFLTQSFISAASFQETKRVLMNSALQSRVDFLYGLKENVIVGRYIRAGTGFRTGLFPSI